jgi:AcrR family transcriptional regulator
MEAMTVQNRRDRERDQTREKIMDAARRLFATEGYEAVSMRQIVKEIEYSPTAIYVHFKDKRDLFHAICREDFGALTGAVQKIIQVADPVERIIKLGLAYCRFGLEHPNHYRLLFMTPVHFAKGEAQAREDQGNADTDSWMMLRFAVTAAKDAGRLRPQFSDIELAAQTFWAGVHGVVSLQIVKGNDPWITWAPVQRRVKAMVEALASGICTDAPNVGKRGKR